MKSACVLFDHLQLVSLLEEGRRVDESIELGDILEFLEELC